MKKARTVDLKEGQTVPPTEFEDVYKHARNSAIWYVTNYSKTTKEVKDKLYDKGYPRGTVFTERNGVRTEVNIVEETIEWLNNALYLDDAYFAESFANSKKRRGFGRSRVSTELFFKGVDEEIIERVLDEVYAEAQEELEEYLTKQHRILSKRETDPWKLKRKLMQKAASRGWDFDLVNEALDSIWEAID